MITAMINLTASTKDAIFNVAAGTLQNDESNPNGCFHRENFLESFLLHLKTKQNRRKYDTRHLKNSKYFHYKNRLINKLIIVYDVSSKSIGTGIIKRNYNTYHLSI